MGILPCFVNNRIFSTNPPSRPKLDAGFIKSVGGAKALIEKFSSIKQVAHAWQLSGAAYIRDLRVEVEGSRFVDFRRIFKESLKDFSAANTSCISQEETDLCCSLLEEREGNEVLAEIIPNNKIFKQDANLLFNDFQGGKPVSISSGFIGHRAVVSFDGDYLLIANKGMSTRRPIEIYKINREKINKSDFQELINLCGEPKAAYKKWLSAISQRFDATKDSLSLCIEQAYPLSSYQQVGNCVWESLQTCVYGTLMLHRLKRNFHTLSSSENRILIDTANKAFMQWREFLQMQSLERYLRANSTPSKPLPSLMEARKEGTANELITFEDIDQNLLRNIFRQFWSTKSTSIEFKKNMDELESQYFKSLQGFALTRAKTEKLYYNQMSRFPYIVRDLAFVWTPSVLTTAIGGVLYHTIRLNLFNSCSQVLFSCYAFSIVSTVQLTRRYFAF